MIRAFNGKIPKISESAYINDTAYIVGDVEIGDHCSIWPGAVIRGDMGKIIIGRYTVVEDNCVIHSGMPGRDRGDLIIGEKVHIGHGAVVNGKYIGNRVLIGMNATVLHGAIIGDDCIIGANCLVSQNMVIPNGSFVVGVPGKIRGKVEGEKLWWIQEGYKEYLHLSELYKKEGI